MNQEIIQTMKLKFRAVHYRPSTIDYRDSSDDDEINLFMLRISKDLFSCGQIGIDNQIQTGQLFADWDLPIRELLAECAPPCTATDSGNSDSESISAQS